MLVVVKPGINTTDMLTNIMAVVMMTMTTYTAFGTGVFDNVPETDNGLVIFRYKFSPRPQTLVNLKPRTLEP